MDDKRDVEACEEQSPLPPPPETFSEPPQWAPSIFIQNYVRLPLHPLTSAKYIEKLLVVCIIGFKVHGQLGLRKT